MSTWMTRGSGRTRSGVLVLLGVVVLAALGLVVSGCQSNGAPAEGSTVSTSQPIDTITVTGTGKATVMPDEAVVSVAVENDADTAGAALDANSKQMQKVLDGLKAVGIKQDQIETSNVVVYPNRRYDQQTGQETLVGYRASNSVTVTMTDMTQVPVVYKAATEAGANNISGPSWQLSDDNQAVNQALAKAFENALSKAQALATAAGVKVGDVMVMNEGSSSTPPIIYGTREMAGAKAADSVTPPPMNPTNIDVTATVTATYRLQR